MDSWAEHILIISLPPGPRIAQELQNVVSASHDRPDCDLILDFSRVDAITRNAFYNLMKVRRLLSRHGHRLALCNTSPQVESALALRNVEDAFQLAQATRIAISLPNVSEHEGIVILRDVDSAEKPEKRRFARIPISRTTQIDVVMWSVNVNSARTCEDCWMGRLVDISEAGAQVAFSIENALCLDKGRAVLLQVAATDTVEELLIEAQVREALPTADEANICLGLSFTGLDRDHALSHAIRQLCESQARYYLTTGLPPQ